MRSIHKKTLKRFLSTLLALTMVLGMVPFTALAAPANGYNLTVDAPDQVAVNQVVDGSSTLTGLTGASGYTAYVTIAVTGPAGANPKILATDTTSGIVYNLAATTTAGTVDTDGTVSSGGMWGPSTGFSVNAGYSATTPLKLKFDVPGTYTATFKLVEQSNPANVICSGTKTITVVGFNSLTANPTAPQPGESFEVTASTTATSGVVQFSYGSQNCIGAVASDGTATATFTAEANQTAVVAILSGISGVDAVTATTTITPGAADTYYDVTFLPGAADAYIPFSPTTVSVKSGNTCAIPAGTPTRPGYVFAGWDSNNDGTADIAAGTTATGTVSGDMTLNALWTRQAVTVSIAASDSDVATALTSGTAGKVGDTVRFKVTIPAKYNTADVLVWAGNSVIKYLSPVAQYYDTSTGETTLYYEFEITENLPTLDGGTYELPITVNHLSLNQYTVMMPVGHFDAKITAANGSTIDPAVSSASVEYGEDYTFTVTPASGYEIKGVYVNGEDKGTTGTYTVTNVTSAQTVEVVVDAIPSYTVTFTVPLTGQTFTQTVIRGGNATAPVVAPEREGYTFGGWYTGDQYNLDGGTQFAFTTTAINNDTILYGKLSPKTYNIAYNANGGSGEPSAQTKTHGTALALSTTVPTRTGYTFLGWSTSASANTPSYQPGEMYSNEGAVTLYAVWQINTFTVTLPNGTGYTAMPASGSSSPVNYDGSFSFTVTVDPEYAVTAPVVKANGTPLSTSDASSPYTYTISHITADQVVSIQVTKNPVYTVTFMVNGSAYQTQQVEYGAKATVPNPPSVEGYTFEGWYVNLSDTSAYNFGTPVTADLTLNAKMTAITPKVEWTASGTGWTLDVTDPSTLTSGDTVTYKSSVEFTVTISTGYDATNLAVAANGLALAPVEVNGNTYKFVLSNITEDQNITVTGVARKTVTITYNANARDDVSDMPEQQVVNYYLSGSGVSDNSKIINQIPVRTGYTFLGWSTKSDATAADAGYDVNTIKSAAGATAAFTKDTTLYAIWEAKATTVTLTIQDYYNTNSYSGNLAQYEGQKITLVAEVEAGSNAAGKGTVTFYKKDINSDTVKAVGSPVTIVDGKASLETTVGKFVNENVSGHTRYCETYWAVFTPEADEGYAAGTSADVLLQVYSSAISWKYQFDNNDDLTIYQADKTTSLGANAEMVAGQTYWLKLPDIVEMNGGKGSTSLTPGTDYIVEWQYQTGENSWTTFNTTKDSDAQWVKITPDLVGHIFHALVIPKGVYTKAATYGSATQIVDDVYASCLTSDPTAETVLQTTTTTLAITGADNEAADVVINGATPFSAAHLAQFEGQTVTLTATVKETSTGTPAVASGSVEFYQNGTLIATVPVETAGTNMGKASFEATMTPFSDTATAADDNNKDVFIAKYVANATYAESTSTPSEVYIKSTAIQTPVIDEIDDNSTVIGSTTYDDDLDGLLAGVKHTFKLRETGASGVTGQTSDWSVVALDGRTVASTDYDIVWNVKTGDNTVTDATVGGTFVTTDNKVGDEISVTLNPKGDMTKGATSKKAIIGTKQDVNVTVTASDEIASTTATDAYQLDEVTLTATVAAAQGANATVKPSGTVTFYYSVDSGSTWTKVGATTDLVEKAGVMTASIKTTELPVAVTTNTKQDVTITAIYSGDNTFKNSGTIDTVGAITNTTGCTVTDETVTVYSSVVYVNSTVENKAVTCSNDHANGIYISVIDGVLNANETNVTLKLSDVYTLDHADLLSKLASGTDYSVQWQKLSNAAAYNNDYAAATGWANIIGKTNTTCDLVVEQGAAYRAVITVGPETDINRGSYTKVDQDIDGRQVYYSNVLVAGSGALDLTVTINTSKTGDGFEGIVEGETVTINTFASGATNTTPISELTVTVTKQGETDPVFEKVKTDVNGYTSFDWATTAPGYYTLEVKAVPSNGYAAKTVTRTLIVRDDKYDFKIVNNITSKVYNGKAQGLTVTVNNMGIENELAQNSVVVYYYSDEARTQMVEPSDAGTYYATIRLQESAYWTEKTENVTFTITKRPVSVVDLVAQAKVYDGTTAANLQEIVLNDATVNAAGVPIDNTGVLNGDSIYATGTGYTSSENAGTVTLNVKDVTLKGDDAANYELDGTYDGEAFVIQRNQLKGDIADATYAWTGSSITVPADDIAVIDQQGNNFTDYKITYYYHNGDGVEKVGAMKELGLYTVVVTPKDTNNYKGGAAQKVYVAATTTPYAAPSTSYSATISITNTVELYGAAGNTGVVATATKGTASVQYYVNSTWTDNRPTNAGRYLVKASVTNDTVTDTAYGLYTIVKADPALSLSASDADYNSALQTGSPVLTDTVTGNTVVADYYTWTGGTIQGVSYTAPTEVGTYVVTAHVNETANYTAHEVSDTYEIKPVTLTITADSYQRHQYGEYPQMTATFSGLATGGVAPDTSLRDVQIQPEFLFSGSNDALDQVGNYTVKPVSALARNYTVEYVDGLFTVTQVDGNPELAICGMISNGNGDKTIAYYGDEIQLYAYGSQKDGIINNSSIWTWDIVSGNATITPEGLLTFGKGNQDVTVRLTRGIGTQSIYTEITIHVLKQEVKVIVPELDVTYSATSQDYTDSKTLQAVNAKGEQVFASNSSFVIAENTRTDIGTQVVTGKVADTIVSYQSETYGGRFTVNDKDVTVTPDAKSVVYGDDLSIAETAFDVDGKVGSVDPLTDTNVASVRELYNNLDVANQYEILVTGTENINYNVKYVTAPNAPQVTVTDRTLNVKTGVYAGTTGQTSGSLNPAGEYPNDDRLAFSASDLSSFAQTTTRMYGEPNQVMGYVLETLVNGDSEADLTTLIDWLVKYDFNIAGHASVTYLDHSAAINASQYPGYTIPAANQQVVTDATMIDLVNYTESYTLGTQNIYQRPVTLKLSNSQTALNIYFAEILTSGGAIDETELRNIIINNVEAGKYNDGTNEVGGLAELLKHTVTNLDLQVTTDFAVGATTFTATVTVGNPNYWLGNPGQKFDITVNILPQRLTVDYTTFTATFSDVILYKQTEATRTPAYATGEVTFKIYRYVEGKENYSYYAANEATVFSGTMTMDTSRTGRYYVTYPKLSAGTYRVFAVASGYTIID